MILEVQASNIQKPRLGHNRFIQPGDIHGFSFKTNYPFQGDQERALGFEPLPLMDRTKAATQSAQGQAGFHIISVILDLDCYIGQETGDLDDEFQLGC